MRKIAFITDTHLDEDLPKSIGVNANENLERIISDVSSKRITEIIFGGDIGDASSHKWFFQTLKQFDYKLILGNHDKSSEVQQYYKNVDATNLKELYYSVEDENFKHIYLDTSSNSLSDDQLKFLSSQLSTPKQILLFMHHPALAVNTVADKLYPLLNRDKLIDHLLRSENQVTIFCGHYHMEDVQKLQNITQYITPSTSFQIVKDAPKIELNGSEFGYTIITLNGDVSLEWVSFRR